MVQALGEFDLDPCAAIDQPWRTAKRQVTVHENGLAHDWSGRVWLNPPYNKQAAVWLQRMASHGRGTALVFARTETRWFKETIWDAATAALFIRGRVYFYRPDGTKAQSNGGAPSVLVAYGRADASALRDSGIEGQFIHWIGG